MIATPLFLAFFFIHETRMMHNLCHIFHILEFAIITSIILQVGSKESSSFAYSWFSRVMGLVSSPCFLLVLVVLAYQGTHSNADTHSSYISEVAVLSAWKAMLSFPTKALDSWDENLVNPCTWIHVTCNENNSVTRLDLGNKKLSGPLSPELSHLKNLQYLELFKNKFYGDIPSSWGNMKNLVGLDLYENSITGKIPESFGNLTSLVFLRLNNNRLHGRIPKSLTEINSLHVLDLAYNHLSGEVPMEGSFQQFSEESFRGNPLCGKMLGRRCS